MWVKGHTRRAASVLQDLQTAPALVGLCSGPTRGSTTSARASFLRYAIGCAVQRTATTTGREIGASGVRGIGLIAPNADLACTLARLSDVVGSLHAHQRVHVHAERLLAAQSHLS